MVSDFGSVFVDNYAEIPWMDEATENIRGGDTCTLLLLILAQVGWTFLWRNSDIVHWAVYINPVFRLKDYIAGITLGLLYSEDRKKHTKISEYCGYCSMMLLLVALTLTAIYNVVDNPWFYTAAWMPLSICLVFLFTERNGRAGRLNQVLFENKVLIWVGNKSMELFLPHQIVIRYYQTIMSKLFDETIRTTVLYRTSSVMLCLAGSILAAMVWRVLHRMIIGKFIKRRTVI